MDTLITYSKTFSIANKLIIFLLNFFLRGWVGRGSIYIIGRGKIKIKRKYKTNPYPGSTRKKKKKTTVKKT